MLVSEVEEGGELTSFSYSQDALSLGRPKVVEGGADVWFYQGHEVASGRAMDLNSHRRDH